MVGGWVTAGVNRHVNMTAFFYNRSFCFVHLPVQSLCHHTEQETRYRKKQRHAVQLNSRANFYFSDLCSVLRY